MANMCKIMCKKKCISSVNLVKKNLNLKIYSHFNFFPTFLTHFFHYFSHLFLINFIHYSTRSITTTKIINKERV